MNQQRRSERQHGTMKAVELANLCVCQHALNRHRSDGHCVDCFRAPWPCSHFVSMAAVRASDRTVGPAWPKSAEVKS